MGGNDMFDLNEHSQLRRHKDNFEEEKSGGQADEHEGWDLIGQKEAFTTHQTRRQQLSKKKEVEEKFYQELKGPRIDYSGNPDISNPYMIIPGEENRRPEERTKFKEFQASKKKEDMKQEEGNKNLFNKIYYLRNLGTIKKNVHQYEGLNSRLDTLQATILLEKIKFTHAHNDLRRMISSFFDKDRLLSTITKPFPLLLTAMACFTPQYLAKAFSKLFISSELV